MEFTLTAASEADLVAINANYASIDFVPSRADELIVVARSAGAIAGQGRVVSIDAVSGELGGIYVLPGYQGQGLARLIVDYLIRHADRPHLYCLPFSELEGFYRSMGFAPVQDEEGVPQPVLQKHRWCNQTYDKPVLLMERVSSAA